MRRVSMTFGVLACLASLAIAQADDPLSPEARRQVDSAVKSSYEKNRREEAQRYLETLNTTTDSSEYYTQIGALRTMQLSPEEGLPIFSGLLAHPSDVVKQGALLALGEYGEKAASLREPIAALLADNGREWFVRATAAESLARVAPDSASALAIGDRLQSGRESVDTERAMLGALGSLGAQARGAVREIESFIQSPHVSLQFAAFEALGKIMGDSAAPAFEASALTEIASARPAQQAMILLSLEAARESATDVSPKVAQLLGSKLPAYLRCGLLQALGKIGAHDHRSVEALLAGIADSDRTTSDIAVRAFRNQSWTDEQLTPALETGLGSANPSVRLYAARALRDYGEKARDALRPALELLSAADGGVTTDEVGALLELVRAVGISNDRVIDVLMALIPSDARVHQDRLGPESHYIRAFTLVVLTEMGAARRCMPTAIEFVATADTAGSHEYAAGAMAIRALGPAAASATPHLVRALQPEFRDRPVTFERFRKAVDFRGSNYTTAKREAIRALASIGPAAKDAILGLEKIVADNQLANLHQDARAALKAIRGE